MPSTTTKGSSTATSTGSGASTSRAKEGTQKQNGHQYATENGVKVPAVAKDAATPSTAPAVAATVEREQAKEPETEEDLLRAYSKELYLYTLNLLNAVRIDSAQKGAGGKAYLLKRTISDIGVPLKGQGTNGGAKEASVATVAAATAVPP